MEWLSLPMASYFCFAWTVNILLSCGPIRVGRFVWVLASRDCSRAVAYHDSGAGEEVRPSNQRASVNPSNNLGLSVY